MTETLDHKNPDSEECVAARKRDKDATKRALLAAAVEVFAERGYDAATTKEVATRAGVNEGLIQRYFAGGDVGGKAGLLHAIVGGGVCGEKLSACRMAPATANLKTEITGFLTHEIEQAKSNRDFMRVLLSRALVDAALAETLRRHYKESRIPLLVERLGRIRDEGKLDPKVDLETLAGTITAFGFGLGFMQQLVLAEDPTYLDTIVAGIAETVARGTATPSAA